MPRCRKNLYRGFMLVALNFASGVSSAVQDVLTWVSRGCLSGVIAVLNMKTSFLELKSFGWYPIVRLLSEKVWVVFLALILIEVAE